MDHRADLSKRDPSCTPAPFVVVTTAATNGNGPWVLGRYLALCSTSHSFLFILHQHTTTILLPPLDLLFKSSSLTSATPSHHHISWELRDSSAVPSTVSRSSANTSSIFDFRTHPRRTPMIFGTRFFLHLTHQTSLQQHCRTIALPIWHWLS